MADSAAGWLVLIKDVQRLGGAPVDPTARGRILDRLMALGCDTVPDLLSCSITVLDEEGRFSTVTGHGRIAPQLDEVQYATGVGPCLSAARTGRGERVDRMDADVRWPEFAAAAVGLGVGASLSVPVPDPASRAALNLYAAHARSFEQRRPRLLAGLVADTAAAVLAASSDHPRDERMARAEQDGRVIRQAQRSVMTTLDLGAGAAYRELGRRSVERGRRLIDIAREELA